MRIRSSRGQSINSQSCSALYQAPKPIPDSVEEDQESALEFPFEIEDNLFEDFGNVTNYPLQARPSSRQRPDLPNEEFSHEDLKDLSTILSHEWTMEAKVAENVL